MSTTQDLTAKGLITPSPDWVPGSIHYETLMGSRAYGVSEETSDEDIYGFCIPPKELIFPHLKGIIQGFGEQGDKFDQYQQHHVIDQAAGKEYDLNIYNIVKYFQLCTGCNPNMIDSLFTQEQAVIFASPIAQHVRDNKKLFLSKKAWPTFKGYAYSQIQKITNKRPTGRRYYLVEKYGYDVKYAYHLVRLLDEAEQILKYGDIDITRDKKRLIEIRKGFWKEPQIMEFFRSKSDELDKVFETSSLPEEPDEKRIYYLLCECLEEAYAYPKGSIGKNRYS